MRAHWNNLSEKEQWMLGLTSIALVIYLFYALVIAPLNHALSTQENQLVDKQQTLAWMQQVRQTHTLQQKRTILSNTQLLTQLDSHLKTGSIQSFPHQLQQTGQGDIQLSFERVPYTLVMDWLFKINRDYAITIKELHAAHTATAGVIHLTLKIANVNAS